MLFDDDWKPGDIKNQVLLSQGRPESVDLEVHATADLEIGATCGDHWRMRGLNAEYNRSVRKFTSTYVSPIIRMHPCTR